MGIKGLLPWLRKTTPKAFLRQSDGGKAFLANRTVAVDVANEVHKLVYIVGSLALPPFEEAVRESVRWFRSCNASPVFVFDGRRQRAKKATTDARKQAKKKMADKAEDLKRRAMHTDAARYERMALAPSGAHYAAYRRVCAAMECPCVTADGEAEKHCVEMELRGEVSAVVSNDSDVLAIGCTHMVSRVGSAACEVVSGTRIRQELGFDLPTFRDFCIMCGTDVSPRMVRVGPVTSCKLIKAHGTLANVLEYLRSRGQADVEDFEEALPVARSFLTACDVRGCRDVSPAAGEGD